MRAPAIVTALVALTSAARADRSTVLTLGVNLDARSYANETQQDPNWNGGLRATLAFEDAPLALPPPGLMDVETHLVPELLAGFISNDARAEGFVGAGLRAEIQLARNQSELRRFRFGFYAAARAKITGEHQDAGGEFVIGDYILLGPSGATRIGWEGGLGVIKRPDLRAEESPELEALITIYAGWKL